MTEYVSVLDRLRDRWRHKQHTHPDDWRLVAAIPGGQRIANTRNPDARP